MNEALEWYVVVWDLAGAPAANQSINWTTVAVGLISGLVGICGSWSVLGWQARRESRSVRAAILAEVEALLELAGRQKYSDQLSKAMHRPAYANGLFRVRLNIPEHYNRVYQANASKLGVLSEKDARHVVRFYQLMDSVRADTSEGGRLYEGTRDNLPFKSTLSTLDEALRTGKSLTVW